MSVRVRPPAPLSGGREQAHVSPWLGSSFEGYKVSDLKSSADIHWDSILRSSAFKILIYKMDSGMVESTRCSPV